MKERPVQIGDVLLVSLPQSVPSGHEQEGIRPAIVVGLPHKVGRPRYPILLLIPMTTQIGRWAKENPFLYPRLEDGTGGLTKPSVVLLDQLRGIDQSRIGRYIGTLSNKEFAPIRKALLLLFK